MPAGVFLNCVVCESRKKSALSDIPDSILDELSKAKIVNTYKRGQTIFYEGNKPYGVYCMNSGKVKLSKHAPEGKNFIVRIAKGGDLLGYRSFFTSELYTATAEVLEDATICFLDRERFFELIKKNPAFSLKLLSLMGHDIKCAEDMSRNLAYKSSQERIVEMLLTLKETYGIENQDGTYKLDILLSREELASMIGTTTETTVRLLTWLKDKNIISLKGKYITIKDLKVLENLIPDY